MEDDKEDEEDEEDKKDQKKIKERTNSLGWQSGRTIREAEGRRKKVGSWAQLKARRRERESDRAEGPDSTGSCLEISGRHFPSVRNWQQDFIRGGSYCRTASSCLPESLVGINGGRMARGIEEGTASITASAAGFGSCRR